MANTAPIFVGSLVNSWANGITAANTAMDGTGTVNTVFTADATNGSYVNKLIVRGLGTNVTTVMRVFINNGSTNATASNNALIGEINIPATTASNTAALNAVELPLNIVLAPGYKINVTLGTAVAAGVTVTAVGGNY